MRAYRDLHTAVIESTDSGNTLRSPTPDERTARYTTFGTLAATLVRSLRG